MLNIIKEKLDLSPDLKKKIKTVLAIKLDRLTEVYMTGKTS